ALLFAAGCDRGLAQGSNEKSAARKTASAEVGKPAPDFTLPDQSGTKHRLQELRGKNVVLEWTNPLCPFVQRHYQAGTMKKLASQFPGDRVTWLAIDSSNYVTPG